MARLGSFRKNAIVAATANCDDGRASGRSGKNGFTLFLIFTFPIFGFRSVKLLNGLGEPRCFEPNNIVQDSVILVPVRWVWFVCRD